MSYDSEIETTPLVYDSNKDCSTVKKVLFIDQSVGEFSQYVNNDTFAIQYSFTSSSTELMEVLRSRFSQIERIGFVFHYSAQPSFMDLEYLFVPSDFTGGSISKGLELVLEILLDFDVQHVDFLACKTLLDTNWRQYFDLLEGNSNAIVSASDDNTGNLKYGGDWILENTMTDVKTIYFNDLVGDYASLLTTHTENYITYNLDSGNQTAILASFLEKPAGETTYEIPCSINVSGVEYDVNQWGYSSNLPGARLTRTSNPPSTIKVEHIIGTGTATTELFIEDHAFVNSYLKTIIFPKRNIHIDTGALADGCYLETMTFSMDHTLTLGSWPLKDSRFTSDVTFPVLTNTVMPGWCFTSNTQWNGNKLNFYGMTLPSFNTNDHGVLEIGYRAGAVLDDGVTLASSSNKPTGFSGTMTEWSPPVDYNLPSLPTQTNNNKYKFNQLSNHDLTDTSIVGTTESEKKKFSKSLLKEVYSTYTDLSGKPFILNTGAILPGYNNSLSTDTTIFNADKTIANSYIDNIDFDTLKDSSFFVLMDTSGDTITLPSGSLNKSVTITQISESSFSVTTPLETVVKYENDTYSYNGLSFTLGSVYGSVVSNEFSLFPTESILSDKYYNVFYTVSKSNPSVLNAKFYDQSQTLISTQDISFNGKTMKEMLAFLENSAANPYAIGKTRTGFRSMDLTYGAVYKKALKDSQQQSLMTYVNKTFKNVYSSAITTYEVKVNSSIMSNSVDFNVLTFGGLTQTQFDAILSSNGFSSTYTMFNYSYGDSSNQQYFPTPGYNVPVLTDVSYGSAISFLNGSEAVGFIQKTYTTADISENTIIQIHYGANELHKDNGWAPSYVYHKTSSQSEFTEIDSTSDIYKNFQYTINPGDTVRIEEVHGGVLLYAIVLSKLDSTNTLKYVIDDVEQPNLVATQIGTYVFDQSDPSNDGHRLKFRNLSDSTTPYTTNVTHEGTPGTPNSYSIIDVTQDTPDLEYYCEVHNGSMYGEFKTLTDFTSYRVRVETNILGDPVFALSPPGTSEYYNQIDVSFGAGSKFLFDVSDPTMADISLVFGTVIDNSSTIIDSFVTYQDGVVILDICSGYVGESLKYFEDTSAGMGYVRATTTETQVNLLSDWTQLGSDIDGIASDELISTSLSADGKTVAVGSMINKYAKVYRFTNSSWSQLGNTMSDSGTSHFGWSLSLSSDGETIIIGASASAPSDNTDGQFAEVYKYNSSTSTWDLSKKFTGTRAFGTSVDITPDGNTIVIGASPFQLGSSGTYYGEIHTYNTSTSTWSQKGATIVDAHDTGYSAAISSDGNTVALGGGLHYGKVFRYANGSWSQLGSNLSGVTYHSTGIALSENGNVVACSSQVNKTIYIYEYGTDWVLLGSRITSTVSDFGRRIALSFDGYTVSAGGLGDYAIVYRYADGSWNQLGSNINAEVPGDKTGYTTGLSSDGNTISIAAPGNDGGGTDSGHVRVFTIKEEIEPEVLRYTVTVSGDLAVFYIDSSANPQLTFTSGITYIFDLSHNSNAGNTLVLGTVPDSSTNLIDYQTIVGTPGQPGAYTSFTASGETVYYYSFETPDMGYEPPTYIVKTDINVLGDTVFSIQKPGETVFYTQPDLSFGAGFVALFDVAEIDESYNLVFGTEVDVSSTIQTQYFSQTGGTIILSIPSDYSGNSLKYFENTTAGMGYVEASLISNTMSSIFNGVTEPKFYWDYRTNTPESDATSDYVLDVMNVDGTNLKARSVNNLVFSDISGPRFNTSPNYYIKIDPFTFGGKCSIETYYYLESFVSHGRAFDFAQSNTDDSFYLSTVLGGNNQPYFAIRNGQSAYSSYGSDSMFLHTWYQTVITVDENGSVEAYINKNDQGLSLTVTNPNIERASNLVGSTNFETGGIQNLNGHIAYTRIWQDHVLTTNEISKLYDSRNIPYGFITNKIYTVTVSGDPVGFYIDGSANPQLTFTSGETYVFDQSHESNAGNTLVLGTVPDSSINLIDYQTIVGTAGQPGAYTSFTASGETVYYYSFETPDMGYQPSTQSSQTTVMSFASLANEPGNGLTSNINTITNLNNLLDSFSFNYEYTNINYEGEGIQRPGGNAAELDSNSYNYTKAITFFQYGSYDGYIEKTVNASGTLKVIYGSANDARSGWTAAVAIDTGSGYVEVDTANGVEYKEFTTTINAGNKFKVYEKSISVIFLYAIEYPETVQTIMDFGTITSSLGTTTNANNATNYNATINTFLDNYGFTYNYSVINFTGEGQTIEGVNIPEYSPSDDPYTKAINFFYSMSPHGYIQKTVNSSGTVSVWYGNAGWNSDYDPCYIYKNGVEVDNIKTTDSDNRRRKVDIQVESGDVIKIGEGWAIMLLYAVEYPGV